MALLPWFRALHIAATVLIGGAFAFEVLILRRCGPAARDPAIAPVVGEWLKRQCAWGVGLGLLSWAGWLAGVAMSMSGLSASRALEPEVIVTVIAHTTFGHVWMIRLGLLVVLGALLMRTRAQPATGAALPFAAALVLVASLAWTGHALGTNRVHVGVDAMHLLAAAAWLGMLPLLALVTHRAVAQPASWGRLAAQCATHFFLPGVTAVLVLIASGLGNTSWMIDSVSDLAGTGYGRVLSVKLGLFALMLVLACVNRLVTVPRIGHAPNAPRALRSLRLSVLAELVLGAAILAVVAWLGVTPPAAHEHTMHRMQTM